MNKKAIRKVKLIEKHLLDLRKMGYDVTFNTPVDIMRQIHEGR